MLNTKKVNCFGNKTILLQDVNGPCPLIAISNTLILRDSPLAHYTADKESVPINELVEELTRACGDSKDLTELVEFLPKLHQGLDVNPRFDGTFSHSKELNIFRLLGVKLVHGWIAGAPETENLGATVKELKQLGELSYEEYATAEVQGNDGRIHQLAKHFLEQYPGQLTTSGMVALLSSLEPDVPVIFFRNNHFSTLVLHDGVLYSLVTDEGYRDQTHIVWESITELGTGHLYGSHFESMDVDIAQDEALARQLQESENMKYPKSKSKKSSSKGNQVEDHTPPINKKKGFWRSLGQYFK